MYIIQGAIAINSGVTLTIDPGVVVKFQTTSSSLTVNGTLNAQGAATSSIYFTSYKDDTVGGDTNEDATSTSPAGGDWKFIELTSTGAANISHSVIRYGGTEASPYAYTNLYNNGGTLTISTSTVSNSYIYGIRQSSGTTTATALTLSNQSTGFYLVGGVASIASSTLSSHTGYGVNGYFGTLTIIDNDFISNTSAAVYLQDPDILTANSGNTSTSTSASANGIYITGTLSSNHTWAADTMPYIPDAITISSGVTLAIDPGTIVKFFTTTSKLSVNGTLTAQGTAASSIYFTSLKDDTVGGDTNGNGGANSPAAGDWKYIDISSTGVANIAHSVIRYGGAEASAYLYTSVYNNGGVLTVSTSTISNAYLYGIRQASGTTTATTLMFSNQATGLYVLGGNATLASSTVSTHTAYGVNGYGGTLTLTNNDFIDNAYAAYISDPDILLSSTGNTATSTSAAKNGIYITGTLNSNRSWAADTMPYIPDAITISSGVTLTIDPGAIVKFFTSTSQLSVSGTLTAQGTVASSINFTSLKDDTVGGDTNGDGAATTPAGGNWKFIEITSTGAANISHAVIRYGGTDASPYAYTNLYNNGGVLTISTSTVSNSYIYGIRQSSGTTTATTVTLSNQTTGLYLVGGVASIASSTLSGNTGYGIDGYFGTLTLTDNDFIPSAGAYAVYLQDPDILTTSTGNTSISTSAAKNGIYINGTLSSNHTWAADTMAYIPESVVIASGVTLTIDPGAIVKFNSTASYFTVSGTLNAGGSSVYPIYFTSYKDDAVGGDTNGNGSSDSPAAGDWKHMEVSSTGAANISYAVIRYGGKDASPYYYSNLYNNGGTLSISTSTISNSLFYGIRQGSGTTVVQDSVIRNNASYGAYNALTSTSTFAATNNYWGTSTGPYHPTLNPSGTGDSISSYISFDPWLGNTNYLLYTDSVDEVNQEMLWKWATSTVSQTYATQLTAAIATWNALNPINVTETAGTADVEVEEVNETEVTWSGMYTGEYSPPRVQLNLDQVGTDPLARIQKTWTHELGHALGLHHSYWENVMYYTRTTQTTLGAQDMKDYHYLWGY